MTKGNGEARMKARMERQTFESGPIRGKRQFVKENKNSGEYIRENVPDASELGTRGGLVVGRNVAMEVLKSDRAVGCVYISNGNIEGSIKVIMNTARGKGLVLKEVDEKKLDTMSNGTDHQRVTASVTPFKYCQIADMLNNAKEKGEDPLMIVLDEIGDPYNLGSIIRTAELYGVRGIIILKGRSVGIASTVHKCSIGAIEHMETAKVTNINLAMDEFKESGLWIYGVDIAGEKHSCQVGFNGPCAMVMDGEGRGISKLILKKYDKLAKIPMVGKINSLNASAAGGIVMYEILKGGLLK